MGSCGSNSSSSSPPVRIDYVAGAIEPVLTRGEQFVVEGYGFGDDSGLVLFTRIGGGTVERAVPAASWTPFAIAVTVPDSAAAGRVGFGIETAAGVRVTATINVLPRATVDPATLTWLSRGTFPGATSGIALAAAQFPGIGSLPTSLYAAGGADAPGLTPDSIAGRRVYIARVTAGGARAIGAWDPSRLPPSPRAVAPPAVGAPFKLRFPGNALYGLDRLDEAATALTLATEVDPEYTEAWNNLGNALSALGRHEEACRAFERALALEPAYADAHFNLGETLAA